MNFLKSKINFHAFVVYNLLVVVLVLLLATQIFGETKATNRQTHVNNILEAQRSKRAPNGEEGSGGESIDHANADGSETTNKPESSGGDPKAEKSGISLSMILGLMLLVCTIIYCIGISYKIFRIFKGTYVEEEPVFLKYK